MTKFRKLRFPIVLALSALYLALYACGGMEWIAVRKAALIPHVSTSAARIFPKLALAALILAATALFGRWYCSLLCPAGLLQEVFSRIGQRLGVSRLRHRPSTMAGTAGPVLMLMFVTGFALVDNFVPADNMDPIALFGRLGLAAGDLRAWSPQDALYYCVLGIAVVLLAVVPLVRGRWFCATLCPVSGLFHLAAKLPGKRLTIETDGCVSCGRCERVCPTGCLDAAHGTLAAERCVLCLRCQDVCSRNAIRYGPGGPPPDKRRLFLDAAALAGAGTAYAAARHIGPRLDFLHPPRPAQVTPPGTGGDRQHRRNCVTCQACVAACPVGIIRPQNAERRPTLDFSRGYCQYNCTSCLSSCPAGAFKAISLEEKHRLRLAETRLILPNCVVITSGRECGACAEVCPTHAVTMRATGAGKPTEPDFDAEYCIGCGACYHVCPAHPRAFAVTGLAVHEQARGIRRIDTRNEPRTPPAPDADGMTDFPF